MSSKSPATGAKITTADIEAAERAEVVARALRLQQAMAERSPLTPEQEHTARLFDRLDRQPTSDDIASAADQQRRQAIYARNVKAGYDEWRPLLDGGD
jgi:phage protein D